MCTAISYKTKDHYFGRTLDFEHSYNEGVTITPRNYPFKFRYVDSINSHYAIIGMACVVNNYPLYFEATNEVGLSMAGLYFLGNAHYNTLEKNKDNIVPFEFIPWILCQCKTTVEAEKLLTKLNLVDDSFSDELPLSPLHWIISDRNKSITVESVTDGLKVYDNPIGVLTNNPPFDKQMFNLNNYLHLSIDTPNNTFSKDINLTAYSRGMGAIGLPGDLSSQSRFVKVAFTKLNSVSGHSEEESVSQFFHILGSVSQQNGCVKLENGEYEKTIYTSCCNTDKGIFYYTSYYNNQITALDLHKENLNNKNIIYYPLILSQQIKYQN